VGRKFAGHGAFRKLNQGTQFWAQVGVMEKSVFFMADVNESCI